MNNPRTRSFHFYFLFTLTLTLLSSGCWPNVMETADIDSDDDDSVALPDDDDDDASDDDDSVALPDDDDDDASDDDDLAWDDLCHKSEDPNDWDCDGIDDSDDSILVVDNQFWIRQELLGNLPLDEFYLVGHGLEVAENDDNVDTDWAQREFPFTRENGGWHGLSAETVEQLPVRDDMRLSISDGSATALLELSEDEVFDYWASFGPDYCGWVPDPICWDNSDYEGPSHSLCLSKQIVEGHIYLSASANCGAHTYQVQL